MQNVVSDEKVAAALNYLTSTDEDAARAKALLEGLELKKKTIIAVAYSNSTEKGVKDKEMDAYMSNEYMDLCSDIQNAVLDLEIYRNKRKRAELTVEVWRSIQANQRKGNI